jgi:hypothetical protein
MNPVVKFFAKILWHHNLKEIIAFIAALVIALVLIIAACGKIFYPSAAHPMLDRSVGVFEILFSIALVLYHRRALVWAVSVVVFSAFCGYTLHWLIHGLPCHCMGKLVKLPTAVTLVTDIVFITISLFLTYVLALPRKYFKRLPLVGLGCALVGYLAACIVWWALKAQL